MAEFYLINTNLFAGGEIPPQIFELFQKATSDNAGIFYNQNISTSNLVENFGTKTGILPIPYGVGTDYSSLKTFCKDNKTYMYVYILATLDHHTDIFASLVKGTKKEESVFFKNLNILYTLMLLTENPEIVSYGLKE